ncbi:PRTRC system protein C [Acidovorax sp.]|uniref:PRTRC system protein C n=1 Tax=Acidovorax sp. TaxID=1872122 RepID=UPI0025BE0D89|nr:PRTRC system protein C [Acidovorax sp.]
MAIQSNVIRRVFRYNGIELADPGAHKTPEQVAKLYAVQFPELLNSVVEGPVTKNAISTFTFQRAAGAKG